jgi:hypothetical protein
MSYATARIDAGDQVIRLPCRKPGEAAKSHDALHVILVIESAVEQRMPWQAEQRKDLRFQVMKR